MIVAFWNTQGAEMIIQVKKCICKELGEKGKLLSNIFFDSIVTSCYSLFCGTLSPYKLHC